MNHGETENSNHLLRRYRKWWISLGIVTAVLIGLRLSLRSPLVLRLVKNRAVALADSSINGRMTVGSLEGDLWSHLKAADITVFRSDTVIHIDTLTAAYSLFDLIGHSKKINSLSIAGFYSRLNREPDSTWNVMKLIRNPAQPADTNARASLTVARFRLSQGRIKVTAPDLLPNHQTLTIHGLALTSRVTVGSSAYSLTLNKLDFGLSSPSLPGPVSVRSAADISNGQFRLDHLIIGFGSSLLHANGQFKQTNRGPDYKAHISGSALSWRFIRSQISSYPLNEDLNAVLSVKGNEDRATVEAQLNGPHLTGFNVSTVFNIKPEPALDEIHMTLEKSELNKLLNDSLLPEIGSATADFKGSIPLHDYREGHLDGTMTVHNAVIEGRSVNRINVNFKGNPEKISADITANSSDQKFTVKTGIKSPWSAEPVWQSSAAFRNIDPAFWINDTTFSGNLSFNVTAGGTGFIPGKSLWTITTRVMKSRFMDIPVDSALIRTKYQHKRIDLTTSVQVGNGHISAAGTLMTGTRPSYTFSAETRHLNMAVSSLFNGLSTSLNMHIKGKGDGIKPSLMSTQVIAKAGSSIINGEQLDTLNARMNLDKGIFSLSNGLLRSQIADGDFNARLNIADMHDPHNNLQYELTLKKLQSLSPFVHLHTLRSAGSLKGNLGWRDSALVFTGTLALRKTDLDSLSFRSIDGNVKLILNNRMEYETSLDIGTPRLGSVFLQNFHISSRGHYGEHSLRGDYKLNVNVHNQVGTQQEGTIFYSPDSTAIRIPTFTLQTSIRQLNLEKPFEIHYARSRLSTDTLALSAENNSAYLKLKINRWDLKQKSVFVDARKLNMTAIQEIFLGKTTLGGILSGHISLEMSGSKLGLESNIRLANISYESMKLDSLKFDAAIRNQHLSASGYIRKDGKTIAEGHADLPFRYGNPAAFDTTFFEHKVSGKLTVPSINLSVFHDFLSNHGWGDLTGTLQFNGSLSGEAGSPDINGKLQLTKTRLSGVEIDSLTAGFDYNHAQHQVLFKGAVASQNEKALSLSGEVPFYCDLRNFSIRLPGKNDSLQVHVQSHDFNLNTLNKFISQRMLAGIGGTLNAAVTITGTVGAPVMNGQLVLNNAGAKIVPANIALSNVSAHILFEPDSIIIRNIGAKSDGTVSVSGDVEMKGWKTSRFDLALNADQFKVLNTRDYKGTLSMQTRLTGTPVHPKLTGKVSINQGEVYLGNFGGKQVEQVTLKSSRNRPDSTYFNLAMYDSLDMDVSLNIYRDFWVRNRNSPEMGLELKGDLNAAKQPADSLHLFGKLETIRGYVSQLGKRFELQKGVLQFSGNPYNPGLDIRSVYQLREPNDITIYYNIGGTVKNPKFSYDSDPSMDLKNIVSYTLFGRPFNSLLSWQQTVTGSSSGTKQAGEAALNLLANQLETLASSQLNLDVVQIDNSGRASGNGTTIKAGKYITDRIFIALLQQLGGNNPTSEVILQYLIRNNLELILTQSDNRKTGVDLEWQYNW